jgi:hypothetical protein
MKQLAEPVRLEASWLKPDQGKKESRSSGLRRAAKNSGWRRRRFSGYRDTFLHFIGQKHGLTGKIKRWLKLPRGPRTRHRPRHE